ncbi:uncharacterized protein LOC144163405 [Haemaphysalis longicornis]
MFFWMNPIRSKKDTAPESEAAQAKEGSGKPPADDSKAPSVAESKASGKKPADKDAKTEDTTSEGKKKPEQEEEKVKSASSAAPSLAQPKADAGGNTSAAGPSRYKWQVLKPSLNP